MLMKFFFLSLIIPPIEFPRILSLWAAACFAQCYFLERYCFVKRYRHQPLYDSTLINVVIRKCLPLGLFIRIGSSCLIFGFTYAKNPMTDMKLNISVNWTTLIPIGVVYVILLVFIVFWFVPLRVWDFHTGLDTFSHGTDLKRIVAAG